MCLPSLHTLLSYPFHGANSHTPDKQHTLSPFSFPFSSTYLLNGLCKRLPCSLCLGNGQDEFIAVLQGGQAKSIAGAICDAVCCIANIIVIAAIVVVSIADTTAAAVVVVVIVVGAVIAVTSIADGQRGRAGCVAGGIRVVRRGGYGAILNEVSIGTYEYLFGANDLRENRKKRENKLLSFIIPTQALTKVFSTIFRTVLFLSLKL